MRSPAHCSPFSARLRLIPQGQEPYTLPKAVPWIPGESIIGLLVRNALPHGFSNPARLLTRTFGPRADLSALGTAHMDDVSAQAFADLLGMERATFDTMHHGSSVPGTVRLFGHALPQDYISLARRKVCSLCLRESSHHRAIWNFGLLTCCPVHGVMLVDRCPRPECARPLTWSTPSVATCSYRRCRASLLDAPVRPCPAQSVAAIRDLLAMVTGAAGASTTTFDVGSMVRFTFCLGMVAHERAERPRPIGFAQDHPDELSAMLQAGWSAITEWPSGFRRFLTDLRVRAGKRKGRYGLQKEFGRLPTFFATLDGEPAAAQLLEEFWSYVASRPELATRMNEIRRRRSENGHDEQFVTAVEASNLLGLTCRRLYPLAKAHDLWLVPPTGKGAGSLLRADRLRQISGELSLSLTKCAAADILNVSKGPFREIERTGVLRPIPVAERLLRERLYRKSDVEDLILSLEARVDARKVPPRRRDLVTVETLARGQITVAGIVSAVMAGRLLPVAIDRRARGLHRLMFAREPIGRKLRGPPPTMSTDEAGILLGVKQQVAYHWVRRKLIRTVTGLGKAERGRRITPEEIEGFRREYVTGTEASRTLGLRPQWVSVRLGQLGVQPVSGPHVDGCRQYLFKRQDIADLNAADFVVQRHPRTARRRKAASPV